VDRRRRGPHFPLPSLPVSSRLQKRNTQSSSKGRLPPSSRGSTKRGEGRRPLALFFLSLAMLELGRLYRVGEVSPLSFLAAAGNNSRFPRALSPLLSLVQPGPIRVRYPAVPFFFPFFPISTRRSNSNAQRPDSLGISPLIARPRTFNRRWVPQNRIVSLPKLAGAETGELTSFIFPLRGLFGRIDRTQHPYLSFLPFPFCGRWWIESPNPPRSPFGPPLSRNQRRRCEGQFRQWDTPFFLDDHGCPVPELSSPVVFFFCFLFLFFRDWERLPSGGGDASPPPFSPFLSFHLRMRSSSNSAPCFFFSLWMVPLPDAKLVADPLFFFWRESGWRCAENPPRFFSFFFFLQFSSAWTL